MKFFTIVTSLILATGAFAMSPTTKKSTEETTTTTKNADKHSKDHKHTDDALKADHEHDEAHHSAANTETTTATKKEEVKIKK